MKNLILLHCYCFYQHFTGYKFTVYCLSWQRTKSQAWFLLIDHDDITPALKSDLQSLQVCLCSTWFFGRVFNSRPVLPDAESLIYQHRTCFFLYIFHDLTVIIAKYLPCNLYALLQPKCSGNIWKHSKRNLLMIITLIWIKEGFFSVFRASLCFWNTVSTHFN